jgi:hypothetical protein
MHRRLIAGLVLLLAAPRNAPAQAPQAEAPQVDVEVPPPQQEIAAGLGLAAGGRVTPGGLQVEGAWLYRLSDLDWFEAGVGFRYGGSSPACFRDRTDAIVCDHPAIHGAAADVRAGIRRYFASHARGQFLPHAEAGITLRVARYGDDDLTGLAVPLWLGGGVRAVVTEGISVGGLARLEVGAGRFNRGLGLEPQVALIVLGGVDFAID